MFFESCKKLGHDEQLSIEVFRQIESFAGYSFCKAHSASYAVESYQSLYLKAYYGIEFMVCAINNGGGFYRTEIYVHEARRSGGQGFCPLREQQRGRKPFWTVRISIWASVLSRRWTSKLSQDWSRKERLNGAFTSLEDFMKRTAIGGETLRTLIFIGAFRFSGKTKGELVIISKMLEAGDMGDGSPVLIEEPLQEYKFPILERNIIEDAFDEIEILGFPVTLSPFGLLKTAYRGDVMTVHLSGQL